MGDVKRWSVTYTKHVKQKRKVYQDGSLHLLSNNKVVLYDECEQLLDSRFLTKDDVMRSGESLAFASFLVDIGDPEGNPNPISHPKIKIEDEKKTPEKTKLRHGQKLSNTFVTKGKPNAAREKAKGINVSPSQKIIREFKKNEMLKYGMQQSPPSATTSSFKEWEALYTTQITQKSKKYHDGFIRMVICGSQGKQVMLYDSCKNQLDKRFLKKDEAINCGQSLTFDAYLVDVGDPIGGNEDDRDVKINGRNLFVDNMVSNQKRSKVSAQQDHLGAGDFAVIGQSQHDAGFTQRVDSNLHGPKVDKMDLRKRVPSQTPLRDEFKKNELLKYGAQQSHPSATTSSFNEWEAMYTTQITQKAKKYHDGFIRVVKCGSHGRQVMLYDSSKNQLDKRFLKKDETISADQSLTFAAYLVNIGDPLGSNEDDTDVKIIGRNWKMTENIDTPADNLVSNPQRSKVSAQEDHVKTGVAIGQPQQGAGCGKRVDSNLHSVGVDEIKLRKRVPSHVPLRDAHQILSFIKKPVAPDRTLIVEEAPVMQCLSESPELVQLDSECQKFQGSIPVDLHPGKPVEEICKVEKDGNEGYTGTSGACNRSHRDVLPTSAVNADSISQNIERPVSTERIQVTRSSAFESPNKRKYMAGLALYDRLQASQGSSVILESSRDFMGSLSSLSNESGSHRYQPHTTMRETGPKSKEQSPPTSDMSRSQCSAEDPGNIRMSCLSKMESNRSPDRPSFDLGF